MIYRTEATQKQKVYVRKTRIAKASFQICRRSADTLLERLYFRHFRKIVVFYTVDSL